MQYYGGKAKQARSLAGLINLRLRYRQPYWEPFCGGCNVVALVDADRLRVASDLHPDVILLWQALQAGWVPPTEMPRERYEALRHAPPSAERALAGFGCSFGGRFFHGYAKDDPRRHGRRYIDSARNGLLRKIATMKDVRFVHGSFFELKPPPGALIYCDPPYRGASSPYTGTPSFDHDRFWARARLLSRDHRVLVSEYSAPPDFRVVSQARCLKSIRGGRSVQEESTEKLFAVGEW